MKQSTTKQFNYDEQRYRSIVNNMTDVVYVLDMSGKIVFVNKAIKKVFGFRPEEVIGKRVANFIPKRNLRLIGDFFKKIARGEEVTAETVIIDKKGKLNEIEVVSRPLTGAGSMEVYGIVRSVVDKKRAKEDLEKFKLAVENAYDNIIITDPDGVVIFANQAIEKVTGFSVREVLGKKAGGRNMWGGLMPYGYYQDMWRTIKKEKKPFYASKNAIYAWLYSVWGQKYCPYLCSKRYRNKRQKKKSKRKK